MVSIVSLACWCAWQLGSKLARDIQCSGSRTLDPWSPPTLRRHSQFKVTSFAFKFSWDPWGSHPHIGSWSSYRSPRYITRLLPLFSSSTVPVSLEHVNRTTNYPTQTTNQSKAAWLPTRLRAQIHTPRFQRRTRERYSPSHPQHRKFTERRADPITVSKKSPIPLSTRHPSHSNNDSVTLSRAREDVQEERLVRLDAEGACHGGSRRGPIH